MAVIFLFASALCWTLFDLTRKKLVANEAPLALTLAFNVGAIPLYGLAWLISTEGVAAPEYWLPSAVAAFLAAMAAVGFITALKLGDIAKVIPVLALTPVISTLAAGLVLDESLTALQWLAMLVTVIAIVGVQGGLTHIKSKPFVLMLLVCFGWGVGIVFDKQALSHSGPFFHGFIQTLIGSAILLVFAVASGWQARLNGSVIRVVPALLIFIGAVVFQWLALVDLDAGVIETVKRSIGIIGALLAGALIFKEQVSRAQIFWCLVILSGIPVILQPEI